MDTTVADKPDFIDDATWQQNERWIKLMNTQAQVHRQQKDPRLYRNSENIIKPSLAEGYKP